MEHGLKDIVFYVQKHISTLGSMLRLPSGSWQAARGARICETCLFPDDISKCIFLTELFQIMAWRRPGAKPLSKPMMVSLLMHLCITWPHWVKNIHGISQISTMMPPSGENELICVFYLCYWMSLWWLVACINDLYTFYIGAVIFVPPLCDHKPVQVAVEGTKRAKRLPWSFKGGTEDIQTLPWTLWSQNGCTGVGHWSPYKKMRTVVNIVYQFKRCFWFPCTIIVSLLADQ